MQSLSKLSLVCLVFFFTHGCKARKKYKTVFQEPDEASVLRRKPQYDSSIMINTLLISRDDEKHCF